MALVEAAGSVWFADSVGVVVLSGLICARVCQTLYFSYDREKWAEVDCWVAAAFTDSLRSNRRADQRYYGGTPVMLQRRACAGVYA